MLLFAKLQYGYQYKRNVPIGRMNLHCNVKTLRPHLDANNYTFMFFSCHSEMSVWL